MSDNECKATKFTNQINAAAIVNQAVLRCQALGLPVTADNVILCVGDFFDPTDPEYSDLIEVVMKTVDYTLGFDASLAAE